MARFLINITYQVFVFTLTNYGVRLVLLAADFFNSLHMFINKTSFNFLYETPSKMLE